MTQSKLFDTDRDVPAASILAALRKYPGVTAHDLAKRLRLDPELVKERLRELAQADAAFCGKAKRRKFTADYERPWFARAWSLVTVDGKSFARRPAVRIA